MRNITYDPASYKSEHKSYDNWLEKQQVKFRFYEELNDFLPKIHHKQWISYPFRYNQTVKDAIEALGIPHAEVDLILVNSQSVGFEYHLQDGDMISVYPVFESLDISGVTNLRATPLRNPKFILDVHLGKLCKYLRMFGFDTYYRNDLKDDEIVKISVDENRIILTRDIGLLKNGAVTHGYWIRSQHSREQLHEVVQRFNLRGEIRPFYRCTVCNGFVEEANKSEVTDKLKENTKLYFDEFYRCKDCGRIYWEGSHYENMLSFMNEFLKPEV